LHLAASYATIDVPYAWYLSSAPANDSVQVNSNESDTHYDEPTAVEVRALCFRYIETVTQSI